MATIHTLMSEAITQYAEKNFNAETPALKRLLHAAKEQGIPDISIGGVQGAFLQNMVRLLKARIIVEIGSLAGYSALTMALAMEGDGIVHCFEKDEQYCAFIHGQAQAMNLQDRIIIHSGNALITLPQCEIDAIDMIFIDADKPSYVDYLELLFPKLRSGGIIIGDNALAWGYIADESPDFEPENVQGIQRFNQALKLHPGLYQPCIIPLGDGMLMAIKK